MPTQIEKAVAFRALHQPGAPLFLFNAWDAGSARAVAAAGAKAIATGSWSVAAAFGFEDGEQLPLALALENLARIVRAVDLPVTLDFERGYGADPAGVEAAVAAAISAGAIGFNIEDGLQDGLRAGAEQAQRLAAARAGAKAAGVPVFLNARTDVFLRAPAETHDTEMAHAALARARLYAEAGADGLFVPGLVAEPLIEMICAHSPLPVNIMSSAAAPSNARLASLGVARVSYGPNPYRLAMQALTQAAQAAFA
jgi:methylisocitrate lyase